MNKNKTIKCSACGASSVIRNERTDLLECQYCGSTMTSHPQPQGGETKTKLSVIMISLPLIVVALMVAFWFGFKNIRVHTSVEQYYPDGTTHVDHKKAIDPLAKPYVKQEDTSVTSYAKLLSITSQVSGETIHDGLYWIFSVTNKGDANLSRPGVVVSLFDSDNKRLAEQSGWSALEVLKPNESTEVLVFLSDPPVAYTDFEANTLASKPNNYSKPQQPILVTDFSVTAKNGSFEIIGDVRNSNAFGVQFTRVLAVARNQAGEPIGLGNAFASIKNLNAGESSGFKLRVGTFLQGQPDYWTVWAQGHK